MTLHDYKLACPTYRFLDHGNLCQACLGGRFQHAVLRRCTREPVAAYSNSGNSSHEAAKMPSAEARAVTARWRADCTENQDRPYWSK